MKGTIVPETFAKRVTPPKIIIVNRTITKTATMFIGIKYSSWVTIPKAFFIVPTMLLVCIPGNKIVLPITVSNAKVIAYHFIPKPFSI